MNAQLAAIKNRNKLYEFTKQEIHLWKEKRQRQIERERKREREEEKKEKKGRELLGQVEIDAETKLQKLKFIAERYPDGEERVMLTITPKDKDPTDKDRYSFEIDGQCEIDFLLDENGSIENIKITGPSPGRGRVS
ncbi:energy transducer TonB [bacterium]|nr:energy transducer TonB [bacterium]